MSDNWIVQNLENALKTWNDKLSEIWQLITQSPEQFKGGAIWNVIVDIHGAVQAIGLALLVLFFVIGVMKTCGSFAEVKKPEHALKLFIRFALAKGVVTYGLELMMALFNIVQGLISTIMNAAGFGSAAQTVLPQEIVTAVEDIKNDLIRTMGECRDVTDQYSETTFQKIVDFERSFLLCLIVGTGNLHG